MSRKKFGSLPAVLFAFSAFLMTAPASATLLWNWSFNSGAETGTFTTNGTAADVAGPFNFLITGITDTASAFEPSLVGASFNEGTQPGNGFLWDGVQPIQFYRGGGAFTNGSNFFSNNFRLTFFAGGGVQLASTSNSTNNISNGFTALTVSLTPSPPPPGTVPEPASLSLLVMGMAGFAANRRRKGA